MGSNAVSFMQGYLLQLWKQVLHNQQLQTMLQAMRTCMLQFANTWLMMHKWEGLHPVSGKALFLKRVLSNQAMHASSSPSTRLHLINNKCNVLGCFCMSRCVRVNVYTQRLCACMRVQVNQTNAETRNQFAAWA